jgi:hypothetical protein
MLPLRPQLPLLLTLVCPAQPVAAGASGNPLQCSDGQGNGYDPRLNPTPAGHTQPAGLKTFQGRRWGIGCNIVKPHTSCKGRGTTRAGLDFSCIPDPIPL